MKKSLSVILCLILLFTAILSFSGCSSDQDKLEEEWQENISGSYPEWTASLLITRFGNKDEVEESSLINFIIDKFETMSDKEVSEMLWEMEKDANDDWNSDIVYLLKNQKILEYIQQRYAYSTLSFEEKLNNMSYLLSETYFEYLNYYTLAPTVTQEEFNEYIAQYGETVYTSCADGGYYADEQDSFGGGKIGLDDSPLESYYSDHYYGDFYVSSGSGTRLDHWYDEEDYSYSHVYFRDSKIDFPSYKIENTDFFFANSLLFYQNDNILNVYIVPDTPESSWDIPQFTIKVTE